jgi:hypothetical protein
MNSQVSIRRSRGVVSGVALILLGLWGGLAPFVGPYFHFGYTPDKAWAYTTGRLYFSAIPGAAALLGGLLVAATRSRAVGVLGGLLAALGGLWLLVGSGVTYYLLKLPSITTGVPIGPGSSAATYTVRMYVEVLALYGAIGAAIIFLGALACGRLSLVTARDVAAAEADGSYYTDYPASQGQADPVGYQPTTGQFPAASTDYSGPTTGQFPTAAGQFPTATGQFSGGSGQFTRPSTFRRPPEEFSGPPTQLPEPPTDPAV